MRTKSVSRELRKKQTLEEAILWEKLRNNKLGYKFRRQHLLGKYIVDFYSTSGNLVIEIDGYFHKLSKWKVVDMERDMYLESRGIRVLRFWGKQVVKDLETVLMVIIDKLPKPRSGSLSLKRREKKEEV